MDGHYSSVIRNYIAHFLAKGSSTSSNCSLPTLLTRFERDFIPCANPFNTDNEISYIPSLCFKVLVRNHAGAEWSTTNFKCIILSLAPI
jgi:hypothetical protein